MTIKEVRSTLNDLIFAWYDLPLDVFHLVHNLRAMPDEVLLTEAQAGYINDLWDEYRGNVTYHEWEE